MIQLVEFDCILVNVILYLNGDPRDLHSFPARLPAILDLGSLAELAEETLIIFPREISPGLYDSVITACTRAGFNPPTVAQAPQTTSAISMVATGFGYTVVPASLGKIDQANVRYLPINGTPLTAQVALAWRRHNLSKAGEHFLALL